jgi:hypothetical protein
MGYYEVKIIKTARPMGNNMDWEMYDKEIKDFGTKEEAEKYIKDQYYYCKKRVKQYQDGKNGEAIPTGWIYCFKSDPCSYDDVKHYEQHWVTISKVNKRIVNF